jgi:hypothetical protein
VGIQENLSKIKTVFGNSLTTLAPQINLLLQMVERGGFEPPKAEPADLQSAPFGHSGTSPKISILQKPAKGIEPPTH